KKKKKIGKNCWLMSFFSFRFADVERAALGSVPANFYESICVPVPDLRDFLAGSSANNNTGSSNNNNNNNSNSIGG
ncbi:Uncharacterized protein APZ42_003378, partial [Daphnia magna]